MSGGGGNQTTTTEPPAYQKPYLQSGLQRAEGLYQQGPSVIPFSPQTETALGLTEQRAMNGSPLTRSAQDYVQNSLQGGFLGSNPYLDATFEKARLASQGGLASEFASSGRNIDASAPYRADQLNNLATSIYGGAYENERNRMQQLVPQAQPLAEADYGDYARLGQVGAQTEDLAREYANAPGTSLDEYLNRVRGYPGGVQSTRGGQGNSLGQIFGGLLSLGGLFGG
jgi:hypothetical protein